MNELLTLSEPVRSVFSFCTLVICIICIFSIILSAFQKQKGYVLLSLIPFVCSYFLWQVLFDLHLFGATEGAAPVSRRLGELPWALWAVCILLLALAAVWILIRVIRWGRQRVTPTAVKICLDQMPCGVCCWLDSGRVLFSNDCMNRLCTDITGNTLLSGDQLRDAAAEGIVTVKDKVWLFSCREINVDGQLIHEMTASDITAGYEKTRALERDKAELSRINRELKEYTRSIDEIVRQQEILKAKVNIHDEMNRLMLSTVAAEGESPEALDRVFSLWEQNALLLCMEANEKAEPESATRIGKLARTLKIDLKWEQELPEDLTGKQRSLFFSAAQEAVANAAKHAAATTMVISFTETENDICCHFTNDGNIPDAQVQFTGGLLNLSLLAGKQGAKVSVENGEKFTLTLFFPKGA